MCEYNAVVITDMLPEERSTVESVECVYLIPPDKMGEVRRMQNHLWDEQERLTGAVYRDKTCAVDTMQVIIKSLRAEFRDYIKMIGTKVEFYEIDADIMRE